MLRGRLHWDRQRWHRGKRHPFLGLHMPPLGWSCGDGRILACEIAEVLFRRLPHAICDGPKFRLPWPRSEDSAMHWGWHCSGIEVTRLTC